MQHDFTASGMVFDEGQVLLIFHQKLSKWLCPGGHIEPNEDPIQAVKREVKEETGMEIEVVGSSDQQLVTENAYPLIMPISIMKQRVFDKKDGEHFHIDLIYRCKLAKPRHSHAQSSDYEYKDYRWIRFEELCDYEMPGDLKELVSRVLSKE